MIQLLKLPMVVFATIVLSFQWIAIAVVGRLSMATHLPLFFQFLIGSVIVLLGLLISDRRPPGVSWRLLQASVTIGGLVYFLAPTFMLVALRVLPSVTGAIFFCAIPLYLSFQYGFFGDRFLHYAVFMVGAILYCVVIRPEAELRALSLLPLIVVALAPAAFALGFVLTKKIFWTHSATDLNFWSMLMAAAVHLTMAIAQGETSLFLEWKGIYWAYLLFLAIVPTGLGFYLYRYAAQKTGAAGSLIFSIGTPVVAAGFSFLLWHESPINVGVLIAFALILAVTAFNAYAIRPSRWMVHYLQNDARQGDRLVCHMDARLFCSGVESKVQIMDISIGGLGFRSETRFEAKQQVQVHLPIGTTGSSVVLDCFIAHMAPGNSTHFPWVGGLDFSKITPEKSQYVVEFLAKISKAG